MGEPACADAQFENPLTIAETGNEVSGRCGVTDIVIPFVIYIGEALAVPLGSPRVYCRGRRVRPWEVVIRRVVLKRGYLLRTVVHRLRMAR